MTLRRTYPDPCHCALPTDRMDEPMKRLLLLLLTILLTAQPAAGQLHSHLYTRPRIPSRDVLERLNLTLAWALHVPTENTKDGIATFQLLPDEGNGEVLIQTRAGIIQLVDAETGDLKWRTPVGGMPYDAPRGAAFNAKSIFITRKNTLFVINRKTGKHRVFTIDKTGVPILGYPLVRSTTTTPSADDVAVFFPSEGRITTYLMPRFEDTQLNLPTIHPERLVTKGDIKDSPQPNYLRTVILPNMSITHPLVLTTERMAALGDDGTLTVLNKFTSKVLFDFKAYGPVEAGLGQYGNMVYFGAEDYILYALNIANGQLYWRFSTGASVTRAPQVTTKDVFVTAYRKGLFRVDRESGRQIWLNPEADQFLAVNTQFVYAFDLLRRLLVIDYLKGTTLARYDTSDYVVPFSNTYTDRIYLANHDGTVVCMHLRDLRAPLHPAAPPPAEAPAKGGPQGNP